MDIGLGTNDKIWELFDAAYQIIEEFPIFTWAITAGVGLYVLKYFVRMIKDRVIRGGIGDVSSSGSKANYKGGDDR